MTKNTVRAIWVFYLRSVRELLSLGIPTLLPPLLIPSLMLFVCSGMYAEVFQRLSFVIPDTPGFGAEPHYAQYVIAAPLVMAAFWGTSSAGIGVAVERQIGFYDRMSLTPMGPRISQIGRRLADGTRIAFSVVVLTFVGLLAGADVPNLILFWSVSVPLLAGLGMAYGGIAFALCLRSGSAEATQAVTPLFLPFLFTSTAFVPLPLIPEWLRPIAASNPLSMICDTVRDAYAGSVDLSDLVGSVVTVLVIAVLSQILIARAERALAAR